MHLGTLIRTRLEHRQNEKRNRAGLEARQIEKFRALVALAVRHAPYYRALVEDRRLDPRTCTPADFPELTKTELMAHFDAIVTDPAITKAGVTQFLSRSQDPYELLDGRYYVVHTSGSSGELGYSVYSARDWTGG